MKFLKNRTVLGIVCIVLALIICFAITPLFNASKSSTMKIIRIKNNMKIGQEITSKDVEAVEVGAYNMPSDVAQKSEDVVGKYAAMEMIKGEYILPTKISDTPASENAYLYGLTGEKRAISITIPSFAGGLSGKLISGDIVSVIAVDYKEKGETVVPEELQYVEVMDNTSPAILGHLSKNIRIAVLKTPLVDEDVGVAASIRIVNAQKLQKEDFIKSGTATDEMMNLLSALVRYGVSTTVAGATSSGKTTLTGWLLSTIPDEKRVFTIENGSRELDLVKRDEHGKVINKVVHTITRESEEKSKSISQDDLLDISLRFHPDYIVVGEMRSSEADSAQEAARTGHTVVTTIHSNSCESTWRRMVTLCKRKYPNVDDTRINSDSRRRSFEKRIVFGKRLTA